MNFDECTVNSTSTATTTTTTTTTTDQRAPTPPAQQQNNENVCEKTEHKTQHSNTTVANQIKQTVHVDTPVTNKTSSPPPPPVWEKRAVNDPVVASSLLTCLKIKYFCLFILFSFCFVRSRIPTSR